MSNTKKIARSFLEKLKSNQSFLVSDLCTTEDDEDLFIFFAEREQQFVDIGNGPTPLPPANYHLMMVFKGKAKDQLEFTIEMVPSNDCEPSFIRSAKTFSLSEDLKERETRMVFDVFFQSILQIIDRLEDQALQAKMQRYNNQFRSMRSSQPK